MDVCIKLTSRKTFFVELWYFDTIREIKRKIRKYHGVPIFRQELYDCKGRVLMDEHDTEFYKITQGTTLVLQLVDSKHKTLDDDNEDDEDDTASSTATLSTKIQLLIKIELTKRKFKLEMEPSDTVGCLRAKIHEHEALPITRLMLNSGMVLGDTNKTLSHYGLIAYSTGDNNMCRDHQVNVVINLIEHKRYTNDGFHIMYSNNIHSDSVFGMLLQPNVL